MSEWNNDYAGDVDEVEDVAEEAVEETEAVEDEVTTSAKRKARPAKSRVSAGNKKHNQSVPWPHVDYLYRFGQAFDNATEETRNRICELADVNHGTYAMEVARQIAYSNGKVGAMMKFIEVASNENLGITEVIAFTGFISDADDETKRAFGQIVANFANDSAPDLTWRKGAKVSDFTNNVFMAVSQHISDEDRASALECGDILAIWPLRQA